MKKNTPQLWDTVWSESSSEDKDAALLLREENTIRWQRIEKAVLKEFASFKGLNVIEIGAGAGTNAALMAKRGAKVAVLDYSKKALARAREFFKRNGLDAEFIEQDALSLPDRLLGQYDIAMSFGLTEHFLGSERLQINKAHFDVLKKGGLAFISVPNKYNPPYRLYKFAATLCGRWRVGEEYAYSRSEFRRICRQIGVDKYSFFGDSLLWSFNFISPLRYLKKALKIQEPLLPRRIKKEKGTFLDQYFSYALVLVGKK